MKYAWRDRNGFIVGFSTEIGADARFIATGELCRRGRYRRVPVEGETVKARFKNKAGKDVEYRGIVLETSFVDNRAFLKVAWYIGTLTPLIRNKIDSLSVKISGHSTRKPRTPGAVKSPFGPRLGLNDEVAVCYRYILYRAWLSKNQDWLKCYRERFPDEETRLYGIHIGSFHLPSGHMRRSLIFVETAHVPTDIGEYSPEARRSMCGRYWLKGILINKEVLKPKIVPINELLFIATNLVTLRQRPRPGLVFSQLKQTTVNWEQARKYMEDQAQIAKEQALLDEKRAIGIRKLKINKRN